MLLGPRTVGHYINSTVPLDILKKDIINLGNRQ